MFVFLKHEWLKEHMYHLPITSNFNCSYQIMTDRDMTKKWSLVSRCKGKATHETAVLHLYNCLDIKKKFSLIPPPSKSLERNSYLPLVTSVVTGWYIFTSASHWASIGPYLSWCVVYTLVHTISWKICVWI